MISYALLFTLAVIGISETVYLIKKRKTQEKPACILGEDCCKVLESKYNKIFGVHNDILGLVFYILISFIAAFLVIGVEQQGLWVVLAKIMIFGGVVMSLFFIYLQWRVIKAWCFRCLMSAFTTFLMAIVVFFV